MFDSNKEFYSNKINSLIINALNHQWIPEEVIDWDAKIILPDNLKKDQYIDMVSQLYYTEEATLYALGRLLTEVPDLIAREFLSTQLMDETRHLRVYKKYLDKLGGVAPVNEKLKKIFETGFKYGGTYRGGIILMNVVLESEALNQQKKRIDTLPCPIFKQMNTWIMKDERRHSAFGKIYMKEKVKTMSIFEKIRIYFFFKKVWKLWGKANDGRYKDESSKVLRTDSTELGIRLPEVMNRFREIGLIKS